MKLRVLISLTLALALALVGFTHKPLNPQQDAQATAYVLSGGSWADICGNSTDPQHASFDHCQACLIGQTCLVPTRTTTPQQLLTATALFPTPTQNISRFSAMDWAYGARAPPAAHRT